MRPRRSRQMVGWFTGFSRRDPAELGLFWTGVCFSLMGPGALENTSNYRDARIGTHLAEGGQPARCTAFWKRQQWWWVSRSSRTNFSKRLIHCVQFIAITHWDWFTLMVQTVWQQLATSFIGFIGQLPYSHQGGAQVSDWIVGRDAVLRFPIPGFHQTGPGSITIRLKHWKKNKLPRVLKLFIETFGMLVDIISSHSLVKIVLKTQIWRGSGRLSLFTECL